MMRKQYRSFYYDDIGLEPVSDDFVIPVGTELDGELLRNLIEEHEKSRVPRYLRLKAAYETKYLIFDEMNTKADYKPDNRLAADLAKYICDTFVGYYIGVPPEIKHPNDDQNEWLTTYIRRNNQQDVDADIAEMSSMFGKAFEMLYQDDDGEPRSVALEPINTFVVYDDSVLKRPLYGVRYAYNEDGKLTGTFSDSERVYSFEQGGADLDISVQHPHVFGEVPIIQYSENRNNRGVYEGVLNMIEAYNKALSEKANDVDYFADAYMVIEGHKLEDEYKKDLREYRLINLWNTNGDSVKAYFLAKPDADLTQENLLRRLEDLIYKTSMVPDISDASFGTASGIALKMRLLPMSNLAGKKDRKFVGAMRRRFQLLANYPNLPFKDWEDVEITMKRNMPFDLESEASMASALSGIVSQETQLSVLSCVEDPTLEIERMEAEREERAEALANGFSRTSEKKDASMYQITSILGQLRRNVITRANALRMMQRIGLSAEEAEQIINDQEEQ